MVNAGQNWRLDCNKSRHSAAELVPGRSIDTVSFCGWAPCHAEAALCENTSCKIPSSRMGNFFVMSSSSHEPKMHAETLSHVFKPLVELPDRHLLASAVGLTLALITGRADLCSAGVFGAGKTRAAAAVIVGLIAIDPTLSIMICTKENAGAQAVAEHIVSMQLPDAFLGKFGRLIGFYEAQKGASAGTAIDVGSQNRNQVLRGSR